MQKKVHDAMRKQFLIRIIQFILIVVLSLVSIFWLMKQDEVLGEIVTFLTLLILYVFYQQYVQKENRHKIISLLIHKNKEKIEALKKRENFEDFLFSKDVVEHGWESFLKKLERYSVSTVQKKFVHDWDAKKQKALIVWHTKPLHPCVKAIVCKQAAEHAEVLVACYRALFEFYCISNNAELAKEMYAIGARLSDELNKKYKQEFGEIIFSLEEEIERMQQMLDKYEENCVLV